MIQRFFNTLAIDYTQWRALTRNALRKDFRQSAMSATFRSSGKGLRTYLFLLFYYFVTGLIFVPLVLTIPDVLVSGTLLTSYTMFMIAALILVEYHSVVISPDDYLILGYQPISSRTFFAARLTNLLFYVLAFSMFMATPSIVALWFKTGYGFLPGMAAFLTVFAANLSAALSMVLVYTAVLKRISIRKLENILAIIQVMLAFFIYSGFMILPELIKASQYRLEALADQLWFRLLPPAWFASIIRAAAAQFTAIDLVLGGVSIAVLIGTAYFSLSKLSIGYSERLAAMAASSREIRSTSRKFTRPFFAFARAYEEKVVSKLIRNQFLYDNRFKMAVLGVLPLTIFYLFMGVQEGPLPDPFVTHELSMGRTGLLYLLVFLFPMMLRSYVTQSDSYQASWIFYVTPTDFSRLVLAEKNFLMIYFVLPFLIILGLIFYYYFDVMLHVLLHILALGLLAHFFLQLAFLYSPDLPFSRPNVKGGRTRNFALLLILIPFLVYLVLPQIFRFFYSNPASYITLVLMLFIVSFILEILIRVRVTTYLKTLDFSD